MEFEKHLRANHFSIAHTN